MLISARTRKGVKRFRRAGFRLTGTPQEIEVNKEQYKQLDAEPMIEISRPAREADDESEEFAFSSDSKVQLLSEAELLKLNKSDLIETAEEFGAEFDPESTKKEIIASILGSSED